MRPTFEIYAFNAAGKRVHCFTWTRDAESGIARAQREAIEFGHTDWTGFYAEPVAL